MDKLSNLIQECKPLYKKRKRQKMIAKAILCASMPLMIFSAMFQVYMQGCDIYLSLENNNLQNELLEDDFGLLR